jgi:hypothetical protein
MHPITMPNTGTHQHRVAAQTDRGWPEGRTALLLRERQRPGDPEICIACPFISRD